MTNIKMPALSPTMTSGTLAKWLVKEGDNIKSGDIIAEIETDKATMELESIDDGIVNKILFKEGEQNIEVGTVMMSELDFWASIILYISRVLAHKILMFFLFLLTLFANWMKSTGLTPASAILPQKIEIIDGVLPSREFITSLICFFVKIAVIFNLIFSFESCLITLLKETFLVFTTGILT